MRKLRHFAVSGETLYAEYKRRLFKWHPGDAAWKDTGLVDTGEPSAEDAEYGFKLAVSGKTVYVGKRDGKLFQSLDGGDSWKDITSTLPLPFTDFTEILFAWSTVYIATDSGDFSITNRGTLARDHRRRCYRQIGCGRSLRFTVLAIRGSTAWRRKANGNRFRQRYPVKFSHLSPTATDCMLQPNGAGCSISRLRKRGMPCLIDRRTFFIEKSFFLIFFIFFQIMHEIHVKVESL